MKISTVSERGIKAGYQKQAVQEGCHAAAEDLGDGLVVAVGWALGWSELGCKPSQAGVAFAWMIGGPQGERRLSPEVAGEVG